MPKFHTQCHFHGTAVIAGHGISPRCKAVPRRDILTFLKLVGLYTRRDAGGKYCAKLSPLPVDVQVESLNMI